MCEIEAIRLSNLSVVADEPQNTQNLALSKKEVKTKEEMTPKKKLESKDTNVKTLVPRKKKTKKGNNIMDDFEFTQESIFDDMKSIGVHLPSLPLWNYPKFNVIHSEVDWSKLVIKSLLY